MIDLTPNTYVSYDEMIEMENDENLIYDEFKKYILKKIFNNLEYKFGQLLENDILFLYKKYDVQFYHVQKYDNEKVVVNDEFVYKNKYSIKIKFYLLSLLTIINFSKFRLCQKLNNII